MSGPRRPAPGDRVRHVTGGQVGTLRQVQTDLWATYGLVRWDGNEGPGMRTRDGWAFVPIGLLEPVRRPR